ncbi:heavy metal-associated isoprenylated plant protein 3-like [Cornus florida]|uniref:heavy metal-associated isoprenylated plant protein 3-like n=1 Tax=Cornus florida TaxID=4283 RepID=UPI00289C852B|nr:heavy metal-associated isoprenylated plant protein 3-like [Cornus florida]
MGEKKADAGTTVVLKIGMHCEGCAKKIKRSVRHFEGVESVKADIEGNKLTVTGKVDPAKLRDRVAEKTKRKVEIVSPRPKKDAAAAGGGGDKKPEEKTEKKSDDKKPALTSTVTLKIRLHCAKCTDKIKRIISKIKDHGSGVESVIAEGKKEKEGGGDKKEKKNGGGAKKEGEAKAAGGGGDDASKKEEPKVEVNKIEYHGYHPQYSYYGAPAPAYNHGYINEGYGDLVPQFNQGYINQGYVMEYTSHPTHVVDYPSTYPSPYPTYVMKYPSYPPPYRTHVVDYPPSYPPPYPTYVMKYPSYPLPYPTHVVDYPPSYPPLYPTHAPQMLSDENPNACYVM